MKSAGHRPLHAICFAAAAAAIALAHAATQPATTAPATAPAAVTLRGTITTTQQITRVAAVDRLWADILKISTPNPKDDFLYPATLDPKTNTFTIPGLLPNRTYDLIVWTTDNAGNTTRWEGVTMDYHRPVKSANAPITDDDKAFLKEFVEKTPAFYDHSRILWMAADARHATLLVELRRTRDFHSGKSGEVIHRVELWYFENLFGGWAKDKNTERVITRWRGTSPNFPAPWQYVPALGGIRAQPNSPNLQLKLPAADAKRGILTPATTP